MATHLSPGTPSQHGRHGAHAEHRVTTSTAAYVVDKTLPSANSFAVSPGIVRAGQQVTITGTATKALSGVAITTSNNDASNQACSFNASNNFTCLVTVADASNEVATATVVLTDSVNNVSAGIAAGSYTVDNTAPTISAVTVGTGSSIPVSAYAYFKKAATVSVEVDALDCNLKTVAVAASYVSTSTGQPVSASMTLANTPGSVGCSTTTKYLFQRAVAADEPNGSTSLSVQATDQAGNVTVGAAQYTVDNVAPTLSSTSFFQPTTVYTTNTTTGTDTFTLNASEPLGAVSVAVVSTDNPTIPIGFISIVLSGSTPLPCNLCVFTLRTLEGQITSTPGAFK